MIELFKTANFMHALLVILGAIASFRFWIKTRFWFPRYVHFLALCGLILGICLIPEIPHDAPILKAKWGGLKLAGLILLFPLIVYFFFIFYGGPRAASEASPSEHLSPDPDEADKGENTRRYTKAQPHIIKRLFGEMKVIFASLFVFVGLFGAVAIVGALGLFDSTSPSIVGIGLGIFMLLLCVISLRVFNPLSENSCRTTALYLGWRWRPRRPREPGFKYVYVNQDGSVREVSPEEKRHLLEDVGREGPVFKGWYESRNAWGSQSGFIKRRRVPSRISILPVNPNYDAAYKVWLADWLAAERDIQARINILLQHANATTIADSSSSGRSRSDTFELARNHYLEWERRREAMA
jgi:hypothetical protein